MREYNPQVADIANNYINESEPAAYYGKKKDLTNEIEHLKKYEMSTQEIKNRLIEHGWEESYIDQFLVPESKTSIKNIWETNLLLVGASSVALLILVIFLVIIVKNLLPEMEGLWKVLNLPSRLSGRLIYQRKTRIFGIRHLD